MACPLLENVRFRIIETYIKTYIFLSLVSITFLSSAKFVYTIDGNDNFDFFNEYLTNCNHNYNFWDTHLCSASLQEA